MRHDQTQSRPVQHLAAFLVFSIAALWTSRAILDDPAAAVTFRVPAKALWAADLRRNVAQVAYVSRALITDPLHLYDGQMCYPTPNSVALGEHMLGEGLLGLPAYLLFDDPVVTFNFVVTVRPLIGALSMYALAYYWTGSFAAALIAGILFGFHPLRLWDPVHPSVVGNELIPAILLSLHMLFVRQTWSSAFALAALAALQMLESLYVVLQLLLAASIYGVYLLCRYRRSIPTVLPKLGLVTGVLAGLALLIFGPYLEARETWGILQGRAGFPATSRFLRFGNFLYPGTCLLSLAALGLLDRLRGARTSRDYDPRLAFAAVGLAALWFVLPLRLPGIEIPTLRHLLTSWLPGMDAIRAPTKVFFLNVVPLAFFAACGWKAVAARFTPSRRAILSTLVVTACMAEVFVPALAVRSFGAARPDEAYRIRPEAEDLEVLQDLSPEAVLDLPLSYKNAGQLFMSRAALLGAYHGRKQAACKASFITPVQLQIEAIAARLPNAAAARELWAIGLRTVLFHGQDEKGIRIKTDKLIGDLAKRVRQPGLVPLGSGPSVRAFLLEAPSRTSDDLETLTAVGRRQAVRAPAGKATELRFGTRSRRATFRHPDPVQPTELVVTWYRDGNIVQSTRVRTLLPLALVPGGNAHVSVADTVPTEAGMHFVTLAVPGDRPHLIGAQRVDVQPQ